MKLSYSSLRHNAALWREIGVTLPAYDPEALARRDGSPRWIHFGPGNLFRAYVARIGDDLAAIGEIPGILAASYNREAAEEIYRKNDCLILSVGLKPNGGVSRRILGSVTDCVATDEGGMARLSAAFRSDALQVVSFTITEKGYSTQSPDAKADLAGGPDAVKSAMGIAAALLHSRYRAGGAPVTLLSLDNCSGNGDKVRQAISLFAEAWESAGRADAGFADYARDPARVGCPISMIDKITPRPDERVREALEKDGIGGMETTLTGRGTPLAAFCNAEEPEYLVVEDAFPGGRPAFERAGVYVADRETVSASEKMKVTTCLNPLHTALAVYGCILGYPTIASEMSDDSLVRLVRKIGYGEGLPVSPDPGIFSPKDFLDEVVEKRLPNPFLPDTPGRIATDTSQKVGIRYGRTIAQYMARPDLTPASLVGIPLAIAGWLRYLMGVRDDGERFELSPDPRIPELLLTSPGTLGAPNREWALSCLAREDLFAVSLMDAGLAERIADYFVELSRGEGAVRRTLEKYLK